MAKKEDTRTDEEKRSYTMSRIRSRATSIEVLLQKALWRRGVRYRKNYRKAPGSPDIAIVKHKIAVFCDGEFWHGKDWAEKKHQIKSNRDYWIRKIERNIERDKRSASELEEQGWHILRFWGNDIKADVEGCVDAIMELIHKIRGNEGYLDFSYSQPPLMVAEEEKDPYSVD
jgi:DNA mismatch endonuclease (patch repair protein)